MRLVKRRGFLAPPLLIPVVRHGRALGVGTSSSIDEVLLRGCPLTPGAPRPLGGELRGVHTTAQVRMPTRPAPVVCPNASDAGWHCLAESSSSRRG